MTSISGVIRERSLSSDLRILGSQVRAIVHTAFLEFMSRGTVDFNTQKTKNLNIQDVPVGNLNVSFFVLNNIFRIWLEEKGSEFFGNNNLRGLRALSS